MKKLLINKKNVMLVIGIAVVMPLLSLMNVQMSVQFGAVIDACKSPRFLSVLSWCLL